MCCGCATCAARSTRSFHRRWADLQARAARQIAAAAVHDKIGPLSVIPGACGPAGLQHGQPVAGQVVYWVGEAFAHHLGGRSGAQQKALQQAWGHAPGCGAGTRRALCAGTRWRTGCSKGQLRWRCRAWQGRSCAAHMGNWLLLGCLQTACSPAPARQPQGANDRTHLQQRVAQLRPVDQLRVVGGGAHRRHRLLRQLACRGGGAVPQRAAAAGHAASRCRRPRPLATCSVHNRCHHVHQIQEAQQPGARLVTEARRRHEARAGKAAQHLQGVAASGTDGTVLERSAFATPGCMDSRHAAGAAGEFHSQSPSIAARLCGI